MALYRWTEEPTGALRAPVLVMAFDAWVDAGGAATGAAMHIARDGRTIATFDSDQLLDYRARRPILDVVDGEVKELAWHELVLKHVVTAERDLFVIVGPEPDFRWKELAAAVRELALRLGVVQVVALGAIPAAVPHTRPVPLLATATPPDQLTPEDRRPEGLLRVPAAALSVVQLAIAEHGIPIAGFFAQVPHYVTAVYAAGVAALVSRVGRHIGVPFATGSVEEEAKEQRVQLDEVLEERPDIKQHVQQLEALTPEGGLVVGGRIPSGDEIAAEVEKYLRGPRDDEN